MNTIDAMKQLLEAIEAFTDPEGNMPADTGEFNDLKDCIAPLRAFIAVEEAKPPLSAEREALVERLRDCNIRGIHWHIDKLCHEAANMLAADAPFAPDWAGYRQGVEDGKADAQQVVVPKEYPATDEFYAWWDQYPNLPQHQALAQFYAAPQPPQDDARVPMTQTEIDDLPSCGINDGSQQWLRGYLRLVEAHHGIKP